jgi:mRNA interferase RelE/StbE
LALRIELLPRAARELRRLPSSVRDRILRQISPLSDDPRPPGVQKLYGSDSYRMRVGDYRMLYIINDAAQVVTIAGVGHRRDVYR